MQHFTKDLLVAALIRAIRTFCQTLAGLITVGAAMDEVNWIHIISVALVATILSFLTSIAAGLPETADDGSIVLDPETQQCKLEITNQKKFANNEPMRFKVDPEAFTELDVTQTKKE